MKQKKIVAVALGLAAIAAGYFLYKKNRDTKAVVAAKNEELAIANTLPSTATPGILPTQTFVKQPALDFAGATGETTYVNDLEQTM